MKAKEDLRIERRAKEKMRVEAEKRAEIGFPMNTIRLLAGHQPDVRPKITAMVRRFLDQSIVEICTGACTINRPLITMHD